MTRLRHLISDKQRKVSDKNSARQLKRLQTTKTRLQQGIAILRRPLQEAYARKVLQIAITVVFLLPEVAVESTDLKLQLLHITPIRQIKSRPLAHQMVQWQKTKLEMTRQLEQHQMLTGLDQTRRRIMGRLIQGLPRAPVFYEIQNPHQQIRMPKTVKIVFPAREYQQEIV